MYDTPAQSDAAILITMSRCSRMVGDRPHPQQAPVRAAYTVQVNEGSRNETHTLTLWAVDSFEKLRILLRDVSHTYRGVLSEGVCLVGTKTNTRLSCERGHGLVWAQRRCTRSHTFAPYGTPEYCLRNQTPFVSRASLCVRETGERRYNVR